jgi:murein endopeptidase
LFRYQVEETEPDDPQTNSVQVLEAIDVKREKTAMSRDKVKFLIKLAMEYDEVQRKFVLKVIDEFLLNWLAETGHCIAK